MGSIERENELLSHDLEKEVLTKQCKGRNVDGVVIVVMVKRVSG